RRQGGRAEGPMRDQDRELRAVLPDQRDQTPRHHAVTAVRMEEQVDPRLVPGRGDGLEVLVDDRDGVHGHRRLEVGPGRRQVGDDRGASPRLLQRAEQPKPLVAPRARHPSEPHSHSMVPGGLLVTSKATRFTPGTSATILPAIRSRTSCGSLAQSAVMASSLVTALITTGLSYVRPSPITPTVRTVARR